MSPVTYNDSDNPSRREETPLRSSEPVTGDVVTPVAWAQLWVLRALHNNVSQSLFSASQALTVLLWSRLSDVVGRKPILLVGLFGLSLSMYSFGLSTSYWGAVFRHVYTPPSLMCPSNLSQPEP